MKTKFIRILSISLMLALPISAHALEVAVEGGLSISSASVNISSGTGSAPTIGSKSSMTYGVSAGVSMFPGLQMETGLMHLPRHVTYTDSSNNMTDLSFNSWLVPVMARFTALPLLSVGVGPYYAMGKGQITSITTPAGGSAGSEVLSDFDSGTNLKKSGFGLMGSVRFGMPVAPLVDFLIDGRYMMDLSDRSGDSSQTAKFKDLQILAGVAFGF